MKFVSGAPTAALGSPLWGQNHQIVACGNWFPNAPCENGTAARAAETSISLHILGKCGFCKRPLHISVNAAKSNQTHQTLNSYLGRKDGRIDEGQWRRAIVSETWGRILRVTGSKTSFLRVALQYVRDGPSMLFNIYLIWWFIARFIIQINVLFDDLQIILVMRTPRATGTYIIFDIKILMNFA